MVNRCFPPTDATQSAEFYRQTVALHSSICRFFFKVVKVYFEISKIGWFKGEKIRPWDLHGEGKRAIHKVIELLGMVWFWNFGGRGDTMRDFSMIYIFVKWYVARFGAGVVYVQTVQQGLYCPK